MKPWGSTDACNITHKYITLGRHHHHFSYEAWNNGIGIAGFDCQLTGYFLVHVEYQPQPIRGCLAARPGPGRTRASHTFQYARVGWGSARSATSSVRAIIKAGAAIFSIASFSALLQRYDESFPCRGTRNPSQETVGACLHVHCWEQHTDNPRAFISNSFDVGGAQLILG